MKFAVFAPLTIAAVADGSQDIVPLTIAPEGRPVKQAHDAIKTILEAAAESQSLGRDEVLDLVEGSNPAVVGMMFDFVAEGRSEISSVAGKSAIAQIAFDKPKFNHPKTTDVDRLHALQDMKDTQIQRMIEENFGKERKHFPRKAAKDLGKTFESFQFWKKNADGKAEEADVMFTIIDKNRSNTVEKDELTTFAQETARFHQMARAVIDTADWAESSVSEKDGQISKSEAQNFAKAAGTDVLGLLAGFSLKWFDHIVNTNQGADDKAAAARAQKQKNTMSGADTNKDADKKGAADYVTHEKLIAFAVEMDEIADKVNEMFDNDKVISALASKRTGPFKHLTAEKLVDIMVKVATCDEVHRKDVTKHLVWESLEEAKQAAKKQKLIIV